MHLLKKIMKRARVKQVDTQLRHMLDLDRSEKVVPHGEVSKRIYLDIWKRRDFSLYGSPMPTVKHIKRKHLELRALASKLGIEFTQKVDTTGDDIDFVEEAEDGYDFKVNKLKSYPWTIGQENEYLPPVGFARNPIQPPHSFGNEEFFSYDGHWKAGKLHGVGKYLFKDGETYEGAWEDNKQHGKGTANYPDGQKYTGEWSKGRYEGSGTLSALGGAVYEGEYSLGRRDGVGKLVHPSGLSYEGQFHDGKPHGRGVMKSKLTGWVYEGQFKR
jgi:hypothetical protein